MFPIQDNMTVKWQDGFDGKRYCLHIKLDDVRPHQSPANDTYLFDLYVFVDNGPNGGDWDNIDKCRGFHGNNLMTNGMLNHIGYGFEEALQTNQHEIGEAAYHAGSFVTF